MPSTEKILKIAITPGEPSGIGPDLCLQVLQEQQNAQVIIIASPGLLQQRAQQLKLPITFKPFNPNAPSEHHKPGICWVLPIEMSSECQVGQLNPSNSHYVLKTITKAAKGCVDELFDGLVTGPVHKGVINDAGYSFSGHTEYIADLTGGQPVMMLATSGLRVALVTTHLPLAKVSQFITRSRLRKVIRVLYQDLKFRFGIKEPRILVSGLNPHAGESGHLGREEIDIIEPVINSFNQQGLKIIGPLPADTLFTPKYLQEADAVLAMYHDQGLPVLKYKGFGQAANITLGLPIIRTSVDHGTALDLAGTGEGEAGSLSYAINTAIEMANHQT